MEQNDFDELIESVREAGRILRDEAEPSRQFSLDDEDMPAQLPGQGGQ
jgi:hypothetical protein